MVTNCVKEISVVKKNKKKTLDLTSAYIIKSNEGKFNQLVSIFDRNKQLIDSPFMIRRNLSKVTRVKKSILGKSIFFLI